MCNTNVVRTKHPNVTGRFGTYSAVVSVIMKVITGRVPAHQHRLGDHGRQLPSEAGGKEKIGRQTEAADEFVPVALVKDLKKIIHCTQCVVHAQPGSPYVS